MRKNTQQAPAPHGLAPDLCSLRARLLPRIQRLRQLYLAGELGGTTHEVYPSLDRQSRENYLYFTLSPCLNFQRKSEGLWRSALATYSDPDTRFVFFPENAARDVSEYQRALAKHRLALQPNRHTKIWHTVSRSLWERFRGDPRCLLQSCDFDVERVKRMLSENAAAFPYINGPKLSNYWLYMLSCFTDVQLRNRGAITVIPDTHVIRATAVLGLVPAGAEASPEVVAAIWSEILEGSGIAPCDIHAPLWRWSRRGFCPEI